MKKKILALCDREGPYAAKMGEYLSSRKELPFEVYTYTEPDKLAALGQREEIRMLVVAESAYTYEVSAIPAGQTVLLEERGEVAGEDIYRVDKYQEADLIYRKIMECYLEKEEPERACRQESIQSAFGAQIIGFYSPVKRCLQTSLALTLGQALSGRGRTLYISFEHYAGWNGLLRQEGRADLSDLICFQEEDGERFRCRLRLTEQKFEGLYYIPPVYAGQNLLYITAAQWQHLLEKIAREGDYEYILLDLGDGIQGLYELLRMCSHIYTIIEEDRAAANKVAQYEHILRMQDGEDVLERTIKRRLPRFRNLSGGMEQYTKGELADYVRQMMEEMGTGEYGT